jgi:hypothetical protein
MLNLIRCRRGASAFVVVLSLTPLIGFMALGGEAGSWYITRQHAQNAADAAAYSGGLALACTFSGPSCIDTQGYSYRGKEFAAQNGFCNSGGASYPNSTCATTLPKNVSQSVAMDRGTWSGSSWTSSATGNDVKATVSQTQPAYLAKILGLTTVTIPAQAIARIHASTKPPCALALTGPISFQGSPNVNAPNCDLASNDPANNAINFTGGGMTISKGTTFSAVGGCAGSSTYCSSTYTDTYTPPVTDPFTNLDRDINTLCGANPTTPATCGLSTTGACKAGSQPIAYTASTPCANFGVTTKGNTAVTLSAGVYFISGTLTLKGGSSITGSGVTLILLPGATIDTTGGGTLTITAPTSAPTSLPGAFSNDVGLFQYMALYDAPCTDTSKSSTCPNANTPKFGGKSKINITGNIYAPTAAVTFQGDPTLNLNGTDYCGELIAASIAFNGNATFDDAGKQCGSTRTPSAQYVTLVQ